jgi:hypothetical protein
MLLGARAGITMKKSTLLLLIGIAAALALFPFLPFLLAREKTSATRVVQVQFVPQSPVQPSAPSVPLPAQADPRNSSGIIENAYRNHANSLPVIEKGTVSRILSDDNKEPRHQRFIVRLPSGHAVLIAHNIDIAPRISDLREGDQITFSGLYEWNTQGGTVHWTHHDPSGQHAGGYLQHNGMFYQ